MKSLFYFLLLFLMISTSTSFAQEVRVLKGLKSFSGKVGEWGIKKGEGIYPARGWVFYDIDQVAVVVVPQDRPDTEGLKAFMKRYPEVQTKLFGTTYEAYAKKGKKKGKKDRPGIVIRCQNKRDCSGTCAAVFGQDCPGCPETFIRCSGNCCGTDYGTHLPKEDSGIIDDVYY
ncbi:MAG: hypothetical protein KDC80_23475 [Saprospiraceae bacterium]|nr:hypothetical protein [Saprospiraceae bacterium]